MQLLVGCLQLIIHLKYEPINEKFIGFFVFHDVKERRKLRLCGKAYGIMQVTKVGEIKW